MEYEMTALPCPRCLPLARAGIIRMSMLQPLPKGALAPLARDGSGKCCHDCASADTLVSTKLVDDWASGRIAVGNEREESLRLPSVSFFGPTLIARTSKPGDLERHHQWLDQNNWFDCE